MAFSFKAVQPFWANPVVVLDMRVRLRGSRAFWNQGFYLAIVSLISIGGYLSATQTGSINFEDPVAMQLYLHQFYNSIFFTLAGLVCLIAPALTAVAVITERQRLTLDLLITTPMTSMQMLTGKLLSSLAFLALLMVLSAPESALCVILGGATIGDIAQTYALLMIDGLVMAAIGLAFSCAAKNAAQAIVMTYGLVLLVIGLTEGVGQFLGPAAPAATTITSPHQAMPLASAIGQINPFIAVSPHAPDVNAFGIALPVWLVAATLAVLLIRLILTAGACRLGMYGPTLAGSLRRQILFMTFLAALAFGDYGAINGAASRYIVMWIAGGAGAIYGIATFCLPALFVPSADESPEGAEVSGGYRPALAFRAAHAGSLPYFHLWLAVLVAGIALRRAWDSWGASSFSDALILAPPALCCFFYFSALGFLYWSLARRAAWMTTAASTACSLAFVVYMFLLLAPGAVLLTDATASGTSSHLGDAVWGYVWLLYPFASNPGARTFEQYQPFIQSGILAYILGLLLYPAWKGVRPGAGARRTKPGAAMEGARS